jgi:membrane-bound metal-dependent hydrolase YbcI (DUF457 family)
MLGRSHAISGVTGWLTLCAGASLAGHPRQPATIVVGACVAAGGALLPDLDHPQSTVAHTLGPITRLAARATSRLADAIQDATCGHCRDDDHNGHRAATHTALAALLLGAVIAGLCAAGGRPAGLAVVFLSSALGARGALTRRTRGTFGALGVGAAVTAAADWMLPAGPWWWLGAPVAFGCLAHCLGDAITKSGCPILWPLRISGCRWYPVGSPRWLRFRTGSGWESAVVVLLLMLGAGSVYVLAA